MRKRRSDGHETRRQLLTAASEVFAKKGFHEATLAEICRKAGANIAAANYHFGGKEALYVESWRFSFERSLKTYPPDGGVLPEAPVEERLRGRIRAIMRRIADPASHDFDILHKEMANPTGLLGPVMQEAVEPILEGFLSIIRELLGGQATEQQVRLCQMSVRAQLFGPLFRERRRRISSTVPPLPTPGLLPEDVEVLAEHVTRFSLAGIREVRRTYEERRIFSENPAGSAETVFGGGL